MLWVRGGKGPALAPEKLEVARRERHTHTAYLIKSGECRLSEACLPIFLALIALLTFQLGFPAAEPHSGELDRQRLREH